MNTFTATGPEARSRSRRRSPATSWSGSWPARPCTCSRDRTWPRARDRHRQQVGRRQDVLRQRRSLHPQGAAARGSGARVELRGDPGDGPGAGPAYTVDTGHMVGWSEGVTYEVKKIGGWKSTILGGEGLVVTPDRARSHLRPDPQPRELPRLAGPEAARRRARDLEGAVTPMTTTTDAPVVASADRSASMRRVSAVPYLPGLDGMRAIAVVAVMVYHANAAWLPGGFLGVEVFFVISGYLITLLLIGEHERPARVGLRGFYMRRARRLLPALFTMLVLLTAYTAMFRRDASASCAATSSPALAYVSNWYQIWVGQGYTATGDFAPLRHLWSLAVEEQFYLIWPLVMVGLLRRRAAPAPGRQLVRCSSSRWPSGGDGGCSTNRARSATCTVHAGAYWQVGGRCIARSTRCTCRRPTGRAACCSARRSPWSGGRGGDARPAAHDGSRCSTSSP